MALNIPKEYELPLYLFHEGSLHTAYDFFGIGSLCTAASCGVKSDDITVAVVKISYKKERVCM